MSAAVTCKHKRVLSVLGAAVVLALGGTVGFARSAQASEATAPGTAQKIQFNIESQPVSAALTALGQQSGLTIIVETQVSKGIVAGALIGSYTADEALQQLLAPTGLRAVYLDSKTVAIRAAATPISNSKQEIASLEEVTVTAQKRTERLLDVPVPVSAISGSSLRDGNKLRLADYYTQVPGLSFAGDPVGGSVAVSIRGLSSGVSFNINPSVGFVIDDVPYGSARADGGSYALPEIDPGDLERMEVLRGPQGTLYGASSLGGLIKYVTVEPSFDGVKGQVSVGMNGIENGDNPGYKAYAAINVPFSETFAVRASGFTRTTPGYIENPIRHVKNIGEVQASGGRLTALWEPSDVFSAKVSAFYQEIDQDGSVRAANPTSPYHASRGLAGRLGELQQDDLQGTGVRKTENVGFNATLRAKFGAAELMSITGYNTTDLRNLADDQRDFGFATASTEDTFGPVVPNNSTQHTFDGLHKLDKVVQEFRLALPLGDRVDALFGAFYTDEDYQGTFISRFMDPATLRVVALRDIGETTFDYKEWAGFANLTVRITDEFDVQVGARRSRNEGTYEGLNRGPHINGVALNPPIIGQKFESSEYVSTYLVTTRYKFTEDHMLYARFSTGYRPGGFNPLNQFDTPFPPYGSDTSKNYEVGFKAALLDGALTLDASVYRIDWDDIQIQAMESFFPYTENGGVARSQGIELSVTARPWTGMDVTGWIALGEAELAEDFPATSTVVGKKGDRLPISGEVSGSVSLTQEFALPLALTGFVGGTYTYVDDRLGNFTGPGFFTPDVVPPRQRFDSYATVDLRAGVRNDTWTVELFVANAANEYGIIYGDADYIVPIKPREVGLNVSRTF